MGGTQSVERAMALLNAVRARDQQGARLVDLVQATELNKPTARRLLLALIKAGFVDQDRITRRYHLGPESYILGTVAGRRFGIHALAVEGLIRLADRTGDTAFLSIRRDRYAVCLHREEGAFPIRTHVLQPGDRHPLGVGAGSLAMLSLLPGGEVDSIIAENAPTLAARYPGYSPDLLRRLAAETRARGYAVNEGLIMPGSWGVGVVVAASDGQPLGALSIAAIESRLRPPRQAEVVALLKQEAQALVRRVERVGAMAVEEAGTPPARAAQSVGEKVSHPGHAGDRVDGGTGASARVHETIHETIKADRES